MNLDFSGLSQPVLFSEEQSGTAGTRRSFAGHAGNSFGDILGTSGNQSDVCPQPSPHGKPSLPVREGGICASSHASPVVPGSDEPVFVTLSGGFVADWSVVCRLIALEARGARFAMTADGELQMTPESMLTANDVAFLRARTDEVRRVLEYQADDSHLFSYAPRRHARLEPA
jgi:hypothetical protein